MGRGKEGAGRKWKFIKTVGEVKHRESVRLWPQEHSLPCGLG